MAGEWWRGAVVYQIYPRSFLDSDGDGIGDLAGITRRLEYVAGLGVDAVWLSPFFRSPMKDFGYDVTDYCDVDPSFGTLADFDALVAKAHRLGLKVLLDMVWGHTSDRHPWFVESRSGRDNPRADWYVWADPRPDGSPPNNWLSVFGGAAWTWDAARRQYYLHHFLKSQPALDWRNPAVVKALLAAGAFWLDRGIDGFRLDAVDFLMHDAALRDNPAKAVAQVPIRPGGLQDNVHDMMQPQLMAAFATIRTLTDRYPGTVTMAELSGRGDGLARVALYTAPGHLDLAYTLALMRRPFTAASLSAALAEAEAKLPGDGLVWALSNHDEVRAPTRWGDGSPQSAKLLLAFMAAVRGTLCLYQGDELGLPEAALPDDARVDPYSFPFWPEYKGRDGCRTPMPWTAEGGFSTGRAWLPIPPDHLARAVALQEPDGDSVLNTFRRLMRWRKRHQALVSGRLAPLRTDADLVAFERAGAGETILCLFNPSPGTRRLPMPEGRAPAEGIGYAVEGGQLVLGPWAAAFLI